MKFNNGDQIEAWDGAFQGTIIEMVTPTKARILFSINNDRPRERFWNLNEHELRGLKIKEMKMI